MWSVVNSAVAHTFSSIKVLYSSIKALLAALISIVRIHLSLCDPVVQQKRIDLGASIVRTVAHVQARYRSCPVPEDRICGIALRQMLCYATSLHAGAGCV